MVSDQPIDAVDVLRAVLKRRSLKLSDVAERLGLPYRTLQNYFAKTTDMPLGVYQRVCRLAAVPIDYPLNGGRTKLNHHALQQALIDVCGEALPSVQIEKNHNLEFIGASITRTPGDLRRDAGTLAVLVEGRYDLAIEQRLSLRLEDE